MNPDPFRPPALKTLGDGFAVVTRGIVQDHQGESVWACVREVVKRCTDLRTPDPARVWVKIGVIRPSEHPQHIQPLPTAAGQFVGPPRRLPGLRHTRNPVKAGGIKVEKVHLATRLGRL